MRVPAYRGNIDIIQAADPAAGAEISLTVPAGQLWRIYSISFPFVTDANVANRTPRLTMDDGNNIFFAAGPNFNQAAGATFTYIFAPGITGGVQTSAQAQVPIPDGLYVQSGYRIRTVTGSIQAGDNYGVMTILAEKWFQGS